MLCNKRQRHIQEGDLVILYERADRLVHVYIKQGEMYNSHLGAFWHNDLIGVEFGSKVYSQNKRGWMFALEPTPELWTESLKHRTQILYTADISMITMQLDLVPGSVVVEAGTGSASLSHAMIRCVSPNGHLHTFEFNEMRSKKASEEFAANKLEDVVTCTHADVCDSAWSFTKYVPAATADALVYDLPSPWLAVPAAAEVLKPGGKLCSFSPCIEQVSKTCKELARHGFTGFKTFETLTRTHQVKLSTDTPAISVDWSLNPPPGNWSGVNRQGADNALEGEPSSKRPCPDPTPQGKTDESHGPPSVSKTSNQPTLYTQPNNDMKGHTGYLLFAKKHVGGV